MRVAYLLSGGVGAYKKYQVNETVANIGAPMVFPPASGAGVALATTTGAADFVGCSEDTVTYVTAQQTDGTSAERLVSLCVSPDAVWIALMSGGATEGTALTLYPVTTASADGLAVTTGTAWNSPTMDEGVVWGYDGANPLQARKITSVSGTAGTVTVAFDRDTVVGDNFLRAPYWPTQGATVQLTTNLYQVDASIAVGTGAQFKPVELILKDRNGEGRTKSYLLCMSTDHVFSGRPT